MKTRINWVGIKWKKVQDVELQRRLDGHPSRERVRQRRMEAYLRALRLVLRIPEREGEQDIRAVVRHALTLEGKRLSQALKKVQRLTLDLRLGNALRDGLAEASQIYHPRGWHGRSGTTKLEIKKLQTEGMTVKEIAKKVGCGVSYVPPVLRALGKTCLSSYRGKEKYRWSKFFPYDEEGRVIQKAAGRWQDFMDKEIAKALGIVNEHVVTQYRRRNGFKRWVVVELADKVQN